MINSFHDISLIYSSTCSQLTFYKFLLQFEIFSSKSGPLSSFHQPKLLLFSKALWSACDWNCYPKTMCFFVEPLGGGWWSEPPGGFNSYNHNGSWCKELSVHWWRKDKSQNCENSSMSTYFCVLHDLSVQPWEQPIIMLSNHDWWNLTKKQI